MRHRIVHSRPAWWAMTTTQKQQVKVQPLKARPADDIRQQLSQTSRHRPAKSTSCARQCPAPRPGRAPPRRECTVLSWRTSSAWWAPSQWTRLSSSETRLSSSGHDFPAVRRDLVKLPELSCCVCAVYYPHVHVHVHVMYWCICPNDIYGWLNCGDMPMTGRYTCVTAVHVHVHV